MTLKFWKWSIWSRKGSTATTKKPSLPKKKSGNGGFYRFFTEFNPITWFAFLAVWGAIVGVVITGALWVLLEIVRSTNDLPTNPLPGWFYFVIWGALALLAFVPTIDKDGNIVVERVPQTYFLAPATVFGQLTRFARKTGNYPCTGAWVGLGRSIAVSNTVTDKDGFVRGGDVTFEVWQDARSTQVIDGKKVGQTRITEPAKNGASVTANLTLILERIRAQHWLDAEDADTEVGNAARQAYLQFLANFNDTDVPLVVDLIKGWMAGEKFVTVFTPPRVRAYRTGSLAKDTNGKALILPLNDGETEAAAIARFTSECLARIEPEMTKGENGATVTLTPVVVYTKHPVHTVIERRGFRLGAANLEGVKFSGKVEEEANKASSEFFQLDGQRRSAEAQEEFRKRLNLNPNATYAEQMAAALAYAQDHPESAQVVISPGGTDSIIKGTALVASTIKKGNNP